jgi:hypothetical protein
MQDYLAYIGPGLAIAGVLLTAPRWAYRIESAVETLRGTVESLARADHESRTGMSSVIERLARIEALLAEQRSHTVSHEERIREVERQAFRVP